MKALIFLLVSTAAMAMGQQTAQAQSDEPIIACNNRAGHCCYFTDDGRYVCYPTR